VPEEAFQDKMVGNYCWGCGADNPAGLQLKSYWDGSVAVARWRPGPEYAAGPRHVLNGGIIATLLDCHGVCSAIAHTYRKENRTIGSEPDIWCATASMTVEYLRPTPIEALVLLRARVVTEERRVTTVECVLEAADKECARASVRAVRVPDEWRHGATS
jgi:acyl-coenzyme A thioesterase PaaI-like protein